MKRDSTLARRLVAELGNPAVTGRRLERWSAAKLLPPGNPPEDVLLRHVAALPDAATQGRPPDEAALILLPRGFGAERVPAAIARVYGAESVADLSTEVKAGRRPIVDPHSDEGSRSIDSQATFLEWMASAGAGPSPLVDLLRTLFGAAMSNAVRDPVVEDPVAPGAAPMPDGSTRKESPERVVHTGLVHMLTLMAGGQPTTYAAMSRFADPQARIDDPGPEGEAALDNYADAAAMTENLLGHLTWLPMEGYIFGAQCMRLMLEFTGVDRFLGSPDRLDLVAGMLAPAGIAFGPALGVAVLDSPPEQT